MHQSIRLDYTRHTINTRYAIDTDMQSLEDSHTYLATYSATSCMLLPGTYECILFRCCPPCHVDGSVDWLFHMIGEDHTDRQTYTYRQMKTDRHTDIHIDTDEDIQTYTQTVSTLHSVTALYKSKGSTASV